MKPITIYFVRHGHVDYPPGVRVRRTPGYHLSERGRAEARQAAEFLKDVPLEAIYHSPLERTTETAQILSEFHRVPLIPSELIHEWDRESIPEVEARMVQFVEELLEGSYKTVAAVSHEGPMRILLIHLSGRRPTQALLNDRDMFPFPTAGVYRVAGDGQRWEIELVFQPTLRAAR